MPVTASTARSSRSDMWDNMVDASTANSMVKDDECGATAHEEVDEKFADGEVRK
jgi:hypothetical protein